VDDGKIDSAAAGVFQTRPVWKLSRGRNRRREDFEPGRPGEEFSGWQMRLDQASHLRQTKSR
jgi:hypothetical protein